MVYVGAVFGPVINSQSISFLLWLAALLTFALVATGILEWVRQRILLSTTVSFIVKLEEKVFNISFEQGSDQWNDGARAF